MSGNTSKLRSVEPLRLHGYVLAEVFVSAIGLPHSLAMQFDTEDGGEASVTLSAREAHDLMLWLQHALSLSEQRQSKTGSRGESSDYWSYESVGYQYLHSDPFGNKYWSEHSSNPNGGGSPFASREVFAKVHKILQREGDNRDVSAEPRRDDAAAVSGTPESYSRSDPSEDARTPAGAGVASPALIQQEPADSGQGSDAQDAARWRFVRDHGLVWADRPVGGWCKPGAVGGVFATQFVDERSQPNGEGIDHGR